MSKFVIAATMLLVMVGVVGAADQLTMRLTEKREVVVEAKDLLIRDPNGVVEDLSLKDLMTELEYQRMLAQECKNNITRFSGLLDSQVNKNAMLLQDIIANGSTVSEVITRTIRENIDQVESEIDRTREILKGTLKGKTDEVAAKIEGFKETRDTVERLAINVEFLLEHAENTEICAADQGFHSGDGNCVPAVPKCAAPPNPTGGNVVVSNPTFIVPGTTAKYYCDSPGHFVDGPNVRVCDEETNTFLPAVEPACALCQVTQCQMCSTSTICGECNEGYIRMADGSCAVETRTIYNFAYSPPLGGHNGRESYYLTNGDTQWRQFKNPPSAHIDGSGTIIGDDIYMIRSSGTLDKFTSATAHWTTDASIAPPFVGEGCCKRPFYATVEEPQSTKFFLFATTGAGMFDGTTWIRFPTHPDGLVNDGATAVVGSKIYLIGGNNGKALASVYVWDSQQDGRGQYEKVAPMITPRYSHAAASYDSKIYVFGGCAAGGAPVYNRKGCPGSGIVDWIDVLDTKQNVWTRLATTMPLPWGTMSSGPLPVFPSGKIAILAAYLTPHPVDNSKSYQYNIADDSWEELLKYPKWGGKNVALFGNIEYYT